ncbi:MAG: hypothetical protein Ct9H90mP2_04400 [Dehalococcoidia bacterium]|nr:MAG: hypothetical protein Ct9H90mP2_04400 [Dehalococcoidia bacterium]
MNELKEENESLVEEITVLTEKYDDETESLNQQIYNISKSLNAQLAIKNNEIRQLKSARVIQVEITATPTVTPTPTLTPTPTPTPTMTPPLLLLLPQSLVLLQLRHQGPQLLLFQRLRLDQQLFLHLYLQENIKHLTLQN